jgi:hypothetical protein
VHLYNSILVDVNQLAFSIKLGLNRERWMTKSKAVRWNVLVLVESFLRGQIGPVSTRNIVQDAIKPRANRKHGTKRAAEFGVRFRFG